MKKRTTILIFLISAAATMYLLSLFSEIKRATRGHPEEEAVVKTAK